MDPKPATNQSVYSGMGNNPLSASDFLGDTLRGVNETSGKRLQSIIRGSFGKGKAAESTGALFKLGKDGKTFSKISGKDFRAATKGLSKDAKALAKGYRDAVNGKITHVVEVVKRSEKLSAYARSHSSFANMQTGADLERAGGGHTHLGNATHRNGINDSYGDEGTFSAIVYDSRKGNAPAQNLPSFEFKASPGELLAHEVLGHAMAMSKGIIDHTEQSIQATNLYLRVNTLFPNYHQRLDHGVGQIANPFGIPNYLSDPPPPLTFNQFFENE